MSASNTSDARPHHHHHHHHKKEEEAALAAGQSATFSQQTTTTMNTGLAPTIVQEPVVIETRIADAALVEEKLHVREKVVVQPIVTRDIDQTEVRQVVQPIHEEKILNTQLRERELAQQEIVKDNFQPVAPIAVPQAQVSQEKQTQRVENAPIIEERIHKKIIEEVQPMVYRDVIQNEEVLVKQKIHEHIVEAAVVSRVTAPVIEAGQAQAFNLGTATTNFTGAYSTTTPGAPLSGTQQFSSTSTGLSGASLDGGLNSGLNSGLGSGLNSGLPAQQTGFIDQHGFATGNQVGGLGGLSGQQGLGNQGLGLNPLGNQGLASGLGNQGLGNQGLGSGLAGQALNAAEQKLGGQGGLGNQGGLLGNQGGLLGNQGGLLGNQQGGLSGDLRQAEQKLGGNQGGLLGNQQGGLSGDLRQAEQKLGGNQGGLLGNQQQGGLSGDLRQAEQKLGGGLGGNQQQGGLSGDLKSAEQKLGGLNIGQAK